MSPHLHLYDVLEVCAPRKSALYRPPGARQKSRQTDALADPVRPQNIRNQGDRVDLNRSLDSVCSQSLKASLETPKSS